jgi:hypothetical protein
MKTAPIDLLFLEDKIKERLPIIKHTCMLYSPLGEQFSFTEYGKNDVMLNKTMTRVVKTYCKESYDFMARDLSNSVKQWLGKYLKEGLVDCLYNGIAMKVPDQLLKTPMTPDRKFLGYLLLWGVPDALSRERAVIYLDFFFYPRYEFIDEFRGACGTCKNFLVCGIKKTYSEGACEIVKRYMQ